jgi:AcrR family transcriptional regulator
MASSPKTKELSLRERAKREKFRKIRLATEKLLKDRTLDEITMREVAHAAAIGEATLFRYVTAKEELLLLVFGNRLDDIITSIENDPKFSAELDRTADEIFAAVDELYRIRAELYLADPKNASDFVRIGLEPGSPLCSTHILQADRYINVIAGLLQHGQESGVLREGWDPYILADNCHSLYIHEVIRTPVRNLSPESLEERLRLRIRAQLEPLRIGDP